MIFIVLLGIYAIAATWLLVYKIYKSNRLMIERDTLRQQRDDARREANTEREFRCDYQRKAQLRQARLELYDKTINELVELRGEA